MHLYLIGGVAALLFFISLTPGAFGRFLADLAEIILRLGSLAITIAIFAFAAYVSLKTWG